MKESASATDSGVVDTPERRRSIAREPITLVVLAVIAGGIWLFAEVADEVVEGESHRVDRRILLAMRNPADPGDLWGPKWLEEAGRDFTALGGGGVLLGVTAATVGGLWLAGRWRLSAVVLVAVVGGLLLSLVLKQSFDRPRPDLVPHGSYVYTQSFPSGHAMLSAVTYLTLGLLVSRVVGRRRLRTYILGIAVVVTLLVGVSRVYLGVHWPTDVLAGWAAGAVWALVCWVLAGGLQSRRHPG